jgi:hypothetical protein
MRCCSKKGSRLDALQSGELGFGEDPAVLSDLGLQRFEPLLHVARSCRTHTADTGGRDRQALLGEFVRNAMLSPTPLVNRHRHNGVLEILRDPERRLGLRRLISRRHPRRPCHTAP